MCTRWRFGFLYYQPWLSALKGASSINPLFFVFCGPKLRPNNVTLTAKQAIYQSALLRSLCSDLLRTVIDLMFVCRDGLHSYGPPIKVTYLWPRLWFERRQTWTLTMWVVFACTYYSITQAHSQNKSTCILPAERVHLYIWAHAIVR